MTINDKYCLREHLVRFDTDQKCHDYLVQVRWNGRPQCPQCDNNKMNYYLKSRMIYKCSFCKKQFSVTNGTIFQKSKLPLPKWFEIIYLMMTTKKGMSSCEISRKVGICQKTAWLCMQKLREALENENDNILSGVIEVDETFIGPDIDRDRRLQVKRTKYIHYQDAKYGYSEGKKRRLRGRPAKQGRKKGSTKAVLKTKEQFRKENGVRRPFERFTVVFGMAERGGKIVLKKLGKSKSDINKINIYPILERQTTRDSVLISDDYSVYRKAHVLFSEHHIIVHGQTFVDGPIYTNNIENVWKHLQAFIEKTYIHISDHHYERYLSEHTYRWNRREKSMRALFEEFVPLALDKAASYKKLTYRDLNKLVA
ncbi:MAG: IS1595 family transposase [Bacteroidia bacterium]